MPSRVRHEKRRDFNSVLVDNSLEMLAESCLYIPELTQPVLLEFHKVFRQPPPGLPPEQVGIDLISGSHPPFLPMYCLSISEGAAVEEEVSELFWGYTKRVP